MIQDYPENLYCYGKSLSTGDEVTVLVKLNGGSNSLFEHSIIVPADEVQSASSTDNSGGQGGCTDEGPPPDDEVNPDA